VSINRFPAALLSLLDAKVMGKTPAELGSELAPVMDLSANYEAACVQQVAQATAGPVGVGGPYALLRVPPGEAWIPISVAGRLTGSGADSVRFMLVSQVDQGVTCALSAWNVAPQVTALGSQLVLNWTPSRRLVLLPGTAFGIEISQAVAAHDVQTEAWVVRLLG